MEILCGSNQVKIRSVWGALMQLLSYQRQAIWMNRDTQKDDTKTHIVSCDTGSQSLSSTPAQGDVHLAMSYIELEDGNIWGSEEIQLWRRPDLDS